jgi:protein subunit release factor B
MVIDEKVLMGLHMAHARLPQKPAILVALRRYHRLMHFPADAPVTQAKLDLLRQRIQRLGVELSAVGEQFIRSGGPGGQKTNKTSSGVRLDYPPLGLQVKWTRERSRALNRFLALRELIDEVEIRLSPGTSTRLAEQRRVRKQKDRRSRR